MNLTKDRVNALEGYLSAPDIALPSEKKEALQIAADLIAYWKSQHPKEVRFCKHCGQTWGMHENGTDACPFNPKQSGTILMTATYEEAP